MRQDERTPLSRSAVQKRLIEDEKYAAINALLPLLFVTLLAIGFTVAIFRWCLPVLPLFWVFLLIGAVPFWVGAAVLLRRALIAFKRYRLDLAGDIVRIETDTVSSLAEEWPSLNSRSQSKVYVAHLTNYGRCVIDSTLWYMLHEGDEVYVAVILRKKPVVYRVYSPLTHRIVEH